MDLDTGFLSFCWWDLNLGRWRFEDRVEERAGEKLGRVVVVVVVIIGVGMVEFMMFGWREIKR